MGGQADPNAHCMPHCKHTQKRMTGAESSAAEPQQWCEMSRDSEMQIICGGLWIMRRLHSFTGGEDYVTNSTNWAHVLTCLPCVLWGVLCASLLSVIWLFLIGLGFYFHSQVPGNECPLCNFALFCAIHEAKFNSAFTINSSCWGLSPSCWVLHSHFLNSLQFLGPSFVPPTH